MDAMLFLWGEHLSHIYILIMDLIFKGKATDRTVLTQVDHLDVLNILCVYDIVSRRLDKRQNADRCVKYVFLLV